MGKLFLVATPIGNLEDITLRAIRILREVDIIACEDTRRAGILGSVLRGALRGATSLEVAPPKGPRLLSYYEENELRRIPEIIQLLKEGRNIALISNAGTPTISDPGFKLVRECISQGIPVEAIPGPSAVITALAVSGLPTDKFLFLGFLPQKQGKRQKALENLKTIQQPASLNSPRNEVGASQGGFNNLTIVFYESPYRILKTLNDMLITFGDINIVSTRELTKMHEEIRREKISEAISHFTKTKPQGEFTILLNNTLQVHRSDT